MLSMALKPTHAIGDGPILWFCVAEFTEPFILTSYNYKTLDLLYSPALFCGEFFFSRHTFSDVGKTDIPETFPHDVAN